MQLKYSLFRMSVPDGMTVNKNSCLFESCVLFPEPYV
ncbi:MAG: hypothetical protein ACI9K1_002860, partial [Arcticibacterium sp.]